MPKIKIRKSGPFYILKHRNYELMDLMISKNKNLQKFNTFLFGEKLMNFKLVIIR